MDEQVGGMTETESERERGGERSNCSGVPQKKKRTLLRRFDVAALSPELGSISHGFSQDNMLSL